MPVEGPPQTAGAFAASGEPPSGSSDDELASELLGELLTGRPPLNLVWVPSPTGIVLRLDPHILVRQPEE